MMLESAGWQYASHVVRLTFPDEWMPALSLYADNTGHWPDLTSWESFAEVSSVQQAFSEAVFADTPVEVWKIICELCPYDKNQQDALFTFNLFR